MDIQPVEFLLSVIGVLLAILAFFLRNIHTDFKDFKNEMIDFKTKLAVRDERDKNITDRLDTHERRITEIEKVKRNLI